MRAQQCPGRWNTHQLPHAWICSVMIGTPWNTKAHQAQALVHAVSLDISLGCLIIKPGSSETTQPGLT